jgi:hypothetical protein
MQLLGVWGLREAGRPAAAWRAELGPDAPLPIHVNVSSRELEQPDLPGVVARVLADAGLDPADLVLEITESGLLERTERPVSVLRAIKETGVRIALDDFGTGYSSLSYLERFPIDELKLDREFIARMASGDDDPVLVRAILDMAHALGLVVVPRVTRWRAPPRRRRSPSWSALLERCHRQPRVVELLPVELGRLLHPRPHHRLAGVVDRVGVGVALLDAHARERARKRGGDPVERVVVVVAHDHAPVVVQPGAGTARPWKLDRLGHQSEGTRPAFFR